MGWSSPKSFSLTKNLFCIKQGLCTIQYLRCSAGNGPSYFVSKVFFFPGFILLEIKDPEDKDGLATHPGRVLGAYVTKQRTLLLLEELHMQKIGTGISRL